MRNAICVRTQTSKVPTQDILLVSISSLFCGVVVLVRLSVGRSVGPVSVGLSVGPHFTSIYVGRFGLPLVGAK